MASEECYGYDCLDQKDKQKIEVLKNPKAIKVIDRFLKLCKPAKVVVIDDSQEDIDYVRELSIKNGEERKLSMEGHTVHYDGYNDQARDKANTRVLITGDVCLSKAVNCGEREEWLVIITVYIPRPPKFRTPFERG